jgi:hypothetical protein
MALITLALASALVAFTAAGAPALQADADAAQPWQTMVAGG